MTPLSDIKFLVNLDLMGNGAEGVMVVNGTINPSEFQLLKSINEKEKYLPEVKIRGKAANSDHYWFAQSGVPAFFFYLGAMPKGMKPAEASLHHTPEFFIDESGFDLGVKAFCQLVFDYAGTKK